ncbi:DUF1641 domain protein [Natrialba magadii ATCC 43099]|uniref:DUF1641 domain protein n=1 Tax=Natrialba magadii (strain ATCC 43099 / DSM 3394 / CCM 3739 / CIP 104546 / IAM 13178 / JCM 8861 / NBRC 102185 / NCIMB 2190 / MS3) TaxID=547559 RepID=D3SRC9_NATMM|nr:DUF1641 domain-containing protein [Natrialba magadii]ADD04634.1 DUF1641 domain protein [Natrialba magadii ATCC 43099]ELY25289.1 hypothetical protein C500_17766 [Natrialba magadii ATCC 43099]
MAQKDQSVDGDFDDTPFEAAEVNELAETLEENDEELAELLETLVVVQELSADLAPELREAAHDSREPIAELRTALEQEETLVLVQRVGENADTLVELLELLEVVDELVGDLVPELKTIVRENRETIARIRVALEREETLTLLERLGENEETLIELLELLDVTYELAEDLVPEAVAVVQENRQPITELRMMVAGFSHAYTDADLEPYQLGQNLGNMLVLGCQLGDEELINSVESGLGAFTEEEPPKKIGLLGMLGALRDDDVRQGLGVLVEFLRRMGSARSN